jgi:hypothetical protein
MFWTRNSLTPLLKKVVVREFFCGLDNTVFA